MDARSRAGLQVDHAGRDDRDHRARSGSTSSCPRAFSRPKTPATCSASPMPRPTSPLRRWPKHQRKVADLVRADKAVAYVNSTVGSGGPNSVTNSGRMLVALKPRAERDSLPEIMARLRQTANVVVGIQIFFQPIQNIQSRPAGSTRVSINTRCSPTIPIRSIAWRPSCATRSLSCPVCSTSPPIFMSRIRRSRSRSIARKPRSMRERRSGAPGALQRLRHAPGRHDLYPGQRLSKSFWRACRVSRRPSDLDGFI